MLILWLVTVPAAIVMGASIGEGEEGVKGQAESEKVIHHLVCFPVRPNQHTRPAGENEALIASQSGKLWNNF